MKFELNLGFIGLILVCLKLFGIIHASWWLVTLPIWAPVVIAFVVMIVAVILGAMSIE